MSGYLKIIKELKSKKNIDDNLKKYFDELLSDYKLMSTIRLTMNYYTFYESITEYEFLSVDLFDEYINKINEVLSSLLENTSCDENIQTLDNLRNDITKRVDELVNISQAFSIVEYAINRVEHKFDDKVAKIDDNVLLQSMLQYIFSDKENVVINDKIKLIIGQLPVRMAKSKLFNIISNTLTLYKGSDITSLDNYVRTLEDAALLNILDNSLFGDRFKELDDMLAYDYKEISENDYNSIREKLNDITTFINNASDCYMSLMDIINDIYEIQLNISREIIDNSINPCKKILVQIVEYMNSKFYAGNLEELDTVFSEIEGIQESLVQEISYLEAYLPEIDSNYTTTVENLNLLSSFDIAKKCMLLNSTSTFVELDTTSIVSTQEQSVSDEYIEKMREQLLVKLSDKLSQYKGLIKRGIMANILSELPVRFKTSDELSEFLLSAISSCKDEAERTAFVEIVDDIIRE